MKLLCTLVLVCACGLAPGSTLPEFQQNLGARLPLNSTFIDAQGQHTALGSYFGKAPVVMVFGYYHCPRLCSTIMDGVLQSVENAGLPYSFVGLSIDPRETAEDAARKLAAYRNASDNAPALHLLTGKQPEIALVAEVAGFAYQYDEQSNQYSHPAGFLVATPDGKISRYFSGLEFDRRQVRLALIEASGGRVGSLTEQILLLCSHYDPIAGRYSVTVMNVVRILGVLTAIMLVMGILYARGRSRS